MEKESATGTFSKLNTARSELLRWAVVSPPSRSTQEILPSHVYIVGSLAHAHFKKYKMPTNKAGTEKKRKEKENQYACLKCTEIKSKKTTTLKHGS